MKGRFGLSDDYEELAERFGARVPGDFVSRYSIAPAQSILAVRAAAGGGREIVPLKWGLIPHWADDPKIGSRLINARAESAWAKPSFSDPFRKRRCLVPANGFYVWRKKGRTRQPYYVRMRDGRVFAFAGLWDRWEGPQGEAIESCTILTTGPNHLIAALQNRMPAILPRDAYDRWLDPDATDPGRLAPLLAPFPEEEMVVHPVDPRADTPGNDGRDFTRKVS